MSLINDPINFTKEEIQKRAAKYEFPNPLAVELFLWDCEIASHLQKTSADIVLKGGTAAQLYLPLEKQRGSRDIDMITPLKKSEVAEIVEINSQSLKGQVRFIEYTPKKPVPNLSLVTYLARTRSKINMRENLEVKIDIFYESPKLPFMELNNIQTYAVDVKRMMCLSPGALIGDKLLTLAEGSIGLELESDYPKQIYDVDMLLQSREITNKTVSDMLTSIKTNTQLEASYRKIDMTELDALRDVTKTMNRYSQVDTSGADSIMKRDIEGFQQFFVNKTQRKPYYEWSERSLRIRFLTLLLNKTIRNELTESDLCKIIAESYRIALKLNTYTDDKIDGLRKQLLSLAESKIPFFKELKGKPLERVFWQVVTPENLQKIKALTSA